MRDTKTSSPSAQCQVLIIATNQQTKTEVANAFTRFKENKIPVDHMPALVTQMQLTHKFFVFAQEANLLPKNNVGNSGERAKELAGILGREVAKSGFANTLRLTIAKSIVESPEDRKTFLENLNETLRCSSADVPFPEDVVASANSLLKGIRAEIVSREGGFACDDASIANTLISKLIELLVPSSADRKAWSTVQRLMASGISAKQAMDTYMALDKDARIKADHDGGLLKGLCCHAKTLEAQTRQVPTELGEGSAIQTLIDRATAIVKQDAPVRYESATLKANSVWNAIVDDKDDAKRTLQMANGGTYDGSIWSATLADDATWTQVMKLASTTCITISPVQFKKCCNQYKKAIECAKVTRETFDAAPDTVWEEEADKRCKRMFTTSKEGTIVAAFHKHIGDKNQLQSKAIAEENSGRRHIPDSWEDVHPSIKRFAGKARDLLPFE